MRKQEEPRKRPSQLQRLAYHEAGHAVAAYLVHRRFTEVSIISDPDKNTLGHCSTAWVPTFAPDVDSSPKTRNQVEARIITSLGGPVAENLLTGRTVSLERSSDIHDALNLSGYVCGDEKEESAYVNWLWECTRLLLGRHWAAIQALAQELVKRRRIGERLARKTIREAMQA